MLNEKQLNKILSEVSSKYKSAATKKDGKADWGELYREACKQADEIEVHSCGDFPNKLIGANFPGETDEEREYRRRSFQPITKPYWKKALGTLNRVWSEQNYSIDWVDEDAKKYFLENFPMGNDVRSFFKSIVTEQKISEPNGVLALDFDLPVREDANGELVIDDTEALEPFATVYDSDDLLMFESNDFALCLSEEKSLVEYGGRKEKVGLVLYLYDNENIYRIAQVGKKVDWQFELSVYYNHALGYLPVWKLKGTPEDVIQDETYYESYFAPALPYLNEAVIIHSTNKSVRNKVSYPIRVYYDQLCTNKDCSNGKVYNDGGASNCSTCGGTGSVKFSPFRDYVHELPTATNDVDKNSVAFPGVSFVAPDGAIIKDNEEVIEKYLENAFLFLNIEVGATGNSKGLNDPTATKSKIDRDEQYILMLSISNELFILFQQFLNAAYEVRYGKESPIKVKPPTTFDLISTDEITARLGEAKKAGLSDLALTEFTLQLFEQEFPQTVSMMAEIAAYSDVLFVKETADITILQTNGNVAKWQILLHVNFQRYVNEMIESNAAFMELTLPEIDKKLVERAKQDEATLSAGANSAGNIMKDIAGGGG